MTINANVFNSNIQNLANFNDLMTVLNSSPTASSLLEDYYDTYGAGHIDLGDAGKGSRESGSDIIMDPTALPPESGVASATQDSWEKFATALAHELGHAIGGGNLNLLNADSAEAARAEGDDNEGIALTDEYKVAKELNTEMYSSVGTGIQQQLDQLAQSEGAQGMYASAFAEDAKELGSAYIDTQNPSGSTDPTLTYAEFFKDQWDLEQLRRQITTPGGGGGGGTNIPGDVYGIQHGAVDEVNNGDGTETIGGTGIPLFGPPDANGVRVRSGDTEDFSLTTGGSPSFSQTIHHGDATSTYSRDSNGWTKSSDDGHGTSDAESHVTADGSYSKGWTKPDGTYGSETGNADGWQKWKYDAAGDSENDYATTAGDHGQHIHNVDGSSHDEDYYADGTYYVSTVNSDGSSSGESKDSYGTVTTSTDDGAGNSETDTVRTDGGHSEGWYHDDGDYYTSTTNADGTYDSWLYHVDGGYQENFNDGTSEGYKIVSADLSEEDDVTMSNGYWMHQYAGADGSYSFDVVDPVSGLTEHTYNDANGAGETHLVEPGHTEDYIFTATSGDDVQHWFGGGTPGHMSGFGMVPMDQ